MKHTKIYTYGTHALMEALVHAPHALLKVYFEPRSIDKNMQKLIAERKIPTAALREGLAKSDMKSGSAHQSIVGQISVHQLVLPYEKFIEKCAAGPDTALLLMSGVMDPHNVGALIRSAAGFGAAGVLMPQKNQAPITGAVLKVSAGMAFRIPLVSIGDMYATVRDLKKRGFKIYGLAGGGPRSIIDETFEGPSVFIVGNEAAGMPRELRALCDDVVSIPLNPQCESLNVAASGAVALYAWSTQHPRAIRNPAGLA